MKKRITPQEVDQIKNDLINEVPRKAIQKRFNVSSATISGIATRLMYESILTNKTSNQ
jgi:hypothetical protein